MEWEDEEPNEYLRDDDADYYDKWRDDCAIDFQEDLDELLYKYFNTPNHYMNSVSHLASALKGSAEYLERYEKEFK